MSTLSAAALVGFGVAAAYAAYSDFVHRMLPNWLCALVLAAGLAFSASVGGWPALGWALLHAVVALAVGMGLFAAGFLGGGDAKYYAGVAAWFPISLAPLLLFVISLAGFVLTVAMWGTLRRRRLRDGGGPGNRFGQVPYGVAIAVGATACLAWSIVGT